MDIMIFVLASITRSYSITHQGIVTREEALTTGQQLLATGAFSHVGNPDKFKDDGSLYQWAQEERIPTVLKEDVIKFTPKELVSILLSDSLEKTSLTSILSYNGLGRLFHL